MKRNWTKITKKISIYFFIFCVFVVIISNFIVNNNAKNKVFSSTINIPKNKVGLLLGTSKILEGGVKSSFFTYRVEATIELYNAKKIDFIVISSSYETQHNDNPQDFKNELLKNGVPENKIYLDYGGHRTLNSVFRIKEVFGQSSVTMISQEFHNERAIYLAEHFGITAIGFNAKDVTNRLGLKTQIREYFARVKLFVDLVFDLKPNFVNEKIEIK